MNPILAAIIISSNLIAFFTFLSLKIDQSVKWNWFIVFIPIFFLNFLFLSHAIILFKRRLRFKLSFELFKIFIYVISNLSILAFEILFCLKMQYNSPIILTVLFVPLWIVLIILIVFLLKVLSN